MSRLIGLTNDKGWSMRNLVNISIIWIAAAVTISIGSDPVNAEDDIPDNLPFIDYLLVTGERLGLYFTIEKWASTREKVSAFETSHVFRHDERIDTAEKLITQLKTEVPGIEAKRNAKNPKIVHLIEKGLNDERRYAMNRRISVRHVGERGNLVDSVKKEVPNIGHLTWIDSREVVGDDSYTSVKVEVMDTPLRDIFTDCVSLEGYSQVLWKASTERKDDGPYTMHIYYGPKDDEAVLKAYEDKVRKERAAK